MLAGAIIWGIIAKFRNKMADISPLINSLYFYLKSQFFGHLKISYCSPTLSLNRNYLLSRLLLIVFWCKNDKEEKMSQFFDLSFLLKYFRDFRIEALIKKKNQFLLVYSIHHMSENILLCLTCSKFCLQFVFCL